MDAISWIIHDFANTYLKGCDSDGTSESTQWGIVGDTFIVGLIDNSLSRI